MTDRYDVIVLGLGATGSAALYRIAKRGARVLGIDQFTPPHDHGSSHGETRITRLAIGEGVHYTPLVRRSHEIWREIERETGASLMTTTGGLILSSAARKSSLHVEGFFDNTLAAARQHGIAHELLDAPEIRRRFPAFAVDDGEVGYYEPDAGFLRPEACVKAELDLALRHGAEIRTGVKAIRFDTEHDRVVLSTTSGALETGKLVLSAGAWLPELLGDAHIWPFRVYRQILTWFDVSEHVDQFAPENFPVFIWELRRLGQGIYGFPAIDGRHGGLKVATEQYAATTTPDAPARDISPEEIAAMHATYVAPHFPGISDRCLKVATCLYTVTPDAGFVIDTHPASDRVIIASPCSGHGFKHSAALGEVLSDLALTGKAAFDLAPFRLDRFGTPP